MPNHVPIPEPNPQTPLPPFSSGETTEYSLYGHCRVHIEHGVLPPSLGLIPRARPGLVFGIFFCADTRPRSECACTDDACMRIQDTVHTHARALHTPAQGDQGIACRALLFEHA